MDNESEDKLLGMSGKKGFSVPENYFEQLNRDIQTRIVEEKLKALSTGKGFIVPPLYFEQLSSRIEAGLTPAEEKKIPKVVRLWQRDLFKYATAACFILITAFGLYLNHTTVETPAVYAETGNEQFPLETDEQSIVEHGAEEQLLQTSTLASEQELEEYILNNFSSNEIAGNL